MKKINKILICFYNRIMNNFIIKSEHSRKNTQVAYQNNYLLGNHKLYIALDSSQKPQLKRLYQLFSHFLTK